MKTPFPPTTHKPPKRHFTLLTAAQGPGGSESEGDEHLDPACLPSPTTKSPESHEGLECLKCPEPHVCLGPHVCPVSPVSEGQKVEKELGGLALRNACTSMGDDVESRFFNFARDVRGLAKTIDRKLTTAERMLAFDEWYYLSQGFLDAGKSREDYLAEFFRKLGKVRVPTGDGDTLNKAVEAVSKLPVSELPVIPGMGNPSESWRRVLGLHREMSRRSARKNKTYFLSCRDTAKAVPGLSHHQANDINLALVELDGVIEIVRLGDTRQGGKATEFRYLLALEP
jgi:hypothetical protein